MNMFIDIFTEHTDSILKTLYLMEVQTSLFVLSALLISRLFKKTSSNFLYILWLIVLIKSLVPPFWEISLSKSFISEVSQIQDYTARSTVWDLEAIILLTWFVITVILFGVMISNYVSLRLKVRDANLFSLDKVKTKYDRQLSWPGVWISKHIRSPFVLGWFRPKIYVDKSASNRDLKSLSAVLFHELAHVNRKDRWIILLQIISQVLHPFNPFVWIMNIHINRYREQICDEYAIKQSGIDPVDYGKLLVSYLETGFSLRYNIQITNGFFETTNGLKQRFYNLITNKEDKMKYFNWSHKLLLFAFLIAIIPISCRVDDNPVVSKDTGEEESVTLHKITIEDDKKDNNEITESAEQDILIDVDVLIDEIEEGQDKKIREKKRLAELHEYANKIAGLEKKSKEAQVREDLMRAEEKQSELHITNIREETNGKLKAMEIQAREEFILQKKKLHEIYKAKSDVPKKIREKKLEKFGSSRQDIPKVKAIKEMREESKKDRAVKLKKLFMEKKKN